MAADCHCRRLPPGRSYTRDSTGSEFRLADLFLSPGHVNYFSRRESAVELKSRSNGAGVVSSGRPARPLRLVIPSNSNGRGVVAGYITRVRAGVVIGTEDVTVFDAAKNQYTEMAIDLGPSTEEVFLTLFGTGIRHRSSLAGVVVRVGGEGQQVTYADAQGTYGAGR